ncbi:MAG: riboflavin synthase [Calditrichaceae bacterium]
MFTGIIEEIGKITGIEPIAGGKRVKISAKSIMNDVKIDDSVAVNGVCLTVTACDTESFRVDAVGDTLKKTTFSKLRQGTLVNLERAVRLMDRLGGHLVQGHVNGVATITQINKLGENYFLEVDVPKELTKYLISEGSIAIDGISLTIARLNDSRVGVSVIPHTWSNTHLKFRDIGDQVNIETDVIAKYVENLMISKKSQSGDSVFSDEWFKKLGY